MFSAIFGFLNVQKTRRPRFALGQEIAPQAMEQSGSSRETELQKREAEVAAAHAQFSETRSKAARIEAELTRAEAEKNDLQARLRANETEIAELRQRIESNQRKAVPDSSASDKTAELQAQLEDTRRQLEAAEREKILLSDKIKITEDKSTDLKTEHKHRPAAARDYPGIHGTVLAVNQAYNFVVLSLGARQGVEANSEMLVLRGGSFIGKIRISSVEPATAIGDIITSTLPRGVQVQPGDTVVYAGNNS